MSHHFELELSAKAPTDVWRKPPDIDTFNAQTFMKTVKISAFKCAEASVSANWERLYDQGGLLLLFPKSSGSKQHWLKTGVEFYNGSAHLSTVSAREWADWSLLPLPVGSQRATVRVEREMTSDNTPGASLLVYSVSSKLDGHEEQKVLVREVTWAFEDEEGELQIGVYAARPTLADSATDELEVVFDWSYDLYT